MAATASFTKDADNDRDERARFKVWLSRAEIVADETSMDARPAVCREVPVRAGAFSEARRLVGKGRTLRFSWMGDEGASTWLCDVVRVRTALAGVA